MSKKTGIAMIVIGCVLLCIIVVAASMVGVGSKALDRQLPDEFLNGWMSYVSDSALLKDVVIPGSHDAGTVEMMWAARTQNRSIKLQMQCGVRYFDIRVQHKYGNMFIFHGPISKGNFEPIIDDVKEFCKIIRARRSSSIFSTSKAATWLWHALTECFAKNLTDLWLSTTAKNPTSNL